MDDWTITPYNPRGLVICKLPDISPSLRPGPADRGGRRATIRDKSIQSSRFWGLASWASRTGSPMLYSNGARQNLIKVTLDACQV
jgi:hypothetical protein